MLKRIFLLLAVSSGGGAAAALEQSASFVTDTRAGARFEARLTGGGRVILRCARGSNRITAYVATGDPAQSLRGGGVLFSANRAKVRKAAEAVTLKGSQEAALKFALPKCGKLWQALAREEGPGITLLGQRPAALSFAGDPNFIRFREACGLE